jgi:hypothetical protein
MKRKNDYAAAVAATAILAGVVLILLYAIFG